MTETPNVMPAYLGWKNGPDDGQNLRLYACDKEKPTAPRWSQDTPVGRTIEKGLTEHYGPDKEGDRYLVVHIGDRFVPDEVLQDLAWKFQDLLAGYDLRAQQ